MDGLSVVILCDDLIEKNFSVSDSDQWSLVYSSGAKEMF